MKAVQINKYGGADVIKLNNIEQPTPSSQTVLVEVHDAGVNPVDWKIREGYLKEAAPIAFPATLGGDFCGIIIEVGDGVTDFKGGDEIYGQASLLTRGSGTFAEFALAHRAHIAHKPKTVDCFEAAALPLAGVSALQALIEHIDLKAGQKILIHGGAGGIGTFAIQLAKHLKAHTATTAKTQDLDYVKNLGVDEVIDYQSQNFEKLLNDYDAVFDTVGGETYAKSFKILKKGGIIVSMLEEPNKNLMDEYGVKAISQFTQVTQKRLIQLAQLVDEGVFKVNIAKIFPLDQTSAALEYLRTEHPNGKVVVRVKE